MKLSLLASGSKGNAVYLESGETRMLIDAGLSAVEIIRRLESISVDPQTLNAILVSHDHNDHIRGAGTLARKLKIPVITSYRTREAAGHVLKKCDLIEFESGYRFTHRDLMIDPFPVTHDAADPIGFVIESSDGKTGFATDFGVVTRLIADKLSNSRMLVLEANHDVDMLMNGPYPWHLKQRIKSRHGHISNSESMELLEDLLHDGLEAVFLAHLSETNNSPELPRDAANTLLAGQNICNPKLVIGEQHRAGCLVAI